MNTGLTYVSDNNGHWDHVCPTGIDNFFFKVWLWLMMHMLSNVCIGDDYWKLTVYSIMFKREFQFFQNLGFIFKYYGVQMTGTSP